MSVPRPSAPIALRGPRPPAGMLVYAIGNIHGRSDLLDRLEEAIVADLRRRKPQSARVVYLGDYIDRGGDSAGTLARLVARADAARQDGPKKNIENKIERVFLRGNHEAFLLGFLDGDSALLDSWLWNGGMATLESYGLSPMTGDHGERWADALRDDLARAMPPAHTVFLRGLASHHRAGDLFFAHAGVRPGVALEDQSADDLLWIRDEFIGSDADFGALVVHGHTVVPAPEVRANRIGIDTGAWRSGRLTAAVFEGDTVAFLAT